jgi:hypothetical protein
MTTQPPDFRALCAELAYVVAEEYGCPCELENGGPFAEGSESDLLARVIAALNTPPLAPIPVSERLPGPEDCDDLGRCWWFAPCAAIPNGWRSAGWGFYEGICAGEDTHWAPHWAIPLPEEQP